MLEDEKAALGHGFHEVEVSMKAMLRSIAALTVLFGSAICLANAPAPWWACDGKLAGDECGLYPSGKGVCTVNTTNCEDDPETSENECLWCDGDPDTGGCSTAGSGAGVVALLAFGWCAARRRSG